METRSILVVAAATDAFIVAVLLYTECVQTKMKWYSVL